MVLQNKNQIRQTILSVRNNLSELEQVNIQHSLAERFYKFILPVIRNAKTIAAYYPAGSELNILPILSEISTELFLPVIKSSLEPLNFYPWKLGDKLVSSNYAPNILEPGEQLKDAIPDIIIAPLIACDLNGNRIGSGKAMYDITISKLREYNPNLIYMSICFDFQLLDSIPTEGHDQKLDIILTESRFIKLTSTRIL